MNKLHSAIVDVRLTEGRDPTHSVANPQPTHFRFRLYDDVIAESVGRGVGVHGEQVLWGDDGVPPIDDRQQRRPRDQLERLVVHLRQCGLDWIGLSSI